MQALFLLTPGLRNLLLCHCNRLLRIDCSLTGVSLQSEALIQYVMPAHNSIGLYLEARRLVSANRMMPVTAFRYRHPKSRHSTLVWLEVFMKLTLLIQILYSLRLKLCRSDLFLRAGLPTGGYIQALRYKTMYG
jgi:hypothetical protein